MSFQIGTATSVQDLMTKIDSFLTVGHSLEPQYTGVGTGTIDNLIGTATSVLETITVTLTSSSAFSVAGSVSGALGTGTVGTAFTSSKCNFTLSAGGTAWVAADTVVFTMTAPWVQKRAINLGTGSDEYVYQAPGNSGGSQIFVGMQRFTDPTGDYDNIRLGGFTAYQSGQVFASQPGVMNKPILPLLRTGSMPYWLAANGRRMVIAVKVSTVYEMAYLGFMLQYPNPTQFPYPMIVGGSLAYGNEPIATSSLWRWSTQSENHRLFPMSGAQSSSIGDDTCRFRDTAGTWMSGTMKAATSSQAQGYLWPWMASAADIRPNLDNSLALFPVVIAEDYTGNNITVQMQGELDGVLFVSGYNNTAENTVSVGRTQHVVFQNVFRNGRTDYCALKLA